MNIKKIIMIMCVIIIICISFIAVIGINLNNKKAPSDLVGTWTSDSGGFTEYIEIEKNGKCRRYMIDSKGQIIQACSGKMTNNVMKCEKVYSYQNGNKAYFDINKVKYSSGFIGQQFITIDEKTIKVLEDITVPGGGRQSYFTKKE